MTEIMTEMSDSLWELVMVGFDLCTTLFSDYISLQSLGHKWKEDKDPLYVRAYLLNVSECQ